MQQEAFDQRAEDWDALSHNTFDVAVVGGGINGACLYHHLCARGYRALLIDKADFASGTSGSSAMWIWGGLRYLQSADFATVARLCASRDRMVGAFADMIRPQTFRLLIEGRGSAQGWSLLAGLYLYWMMGLMRRRRPRRESLFPEAALVRNASTALAYEEATVFPSDARFVLSWILPNRSAASPALNYCELRGGRWDIMAREWRLEIADSIRGRETTTGARCVVNAAGCWTDQINQVFERPAPWRHRFGKGVFIAIERDPRHRVPLILRTREHGAMSLIPWGPVSLWGPCDQIIERTEDGYRAEAPEVEFLIDEFNYHFAHHLTSHEIVSARCGVRPLAVSSSGAAADAPIDQMSRRSCVYRDPTLPWISVYGGKLTHCVALAEETVRKVAETVTTTGDARSTVSRASGDAWELFPGLDEKVPAAGWCARYEMCWSLEDYLRRRTNIAQWIPQGGLGRARENIPHLLHLAEEFTDDRATARESLEAYARKAIAEARVVNGDAPRLHDLTPDLQGTLP